MHRSRVKWVCVEGRLLSTYGQELNSISIQSIRTSIVLVVTYHHVLPVDLWDEILDLGPSSLLPRPGNLSPSPSVVALAVVGGTSLILLASRHFACITMRAMTSVLLVRKFEFVMPCMALTLK